VQTAQTVKYVPGNLKGLNDMLDIITVKYAVINYELLVYLG